MASGSNGVKAKMKMTAWHGEEIIEKWQLSKMAWRSAKQHRNNQ
jgi:hypothetical protein